jgi:carbamoyltransferase
VLGVNAVLQARAAALVVSGVDRGALVAWSQGRPEHGSASLGHRSLLADPSRREHLDKLDRAEGRERFCPGAMMVAAEHAPDMFSGGPLPSPCPLFAQGAAPER